MRIGTTIWTLQTRDRRVLRPITKAKNLGVVAHLDIDMMITSFEHDSISMAAELTMCVVSSDVTEDSVNC